LNWLWTWERTELNFCSVFTSKPLHRPLSLSKRLVRIFGAIVEPFVAFSVPGSIAKSAPTTWWVSFSQAFPCSTLLVGPPAVAAYQNFSGMTDVVTKEASSLAAPYRDLRAYPRPRWMSRLGDIVSHLHSKLSAFSLSPPT
jgi:hypothetical protein